MDYFYKQTEHGFEIVIADSLENYTALFTVATKDDGQSALKVLNDLQAQLATAHAAREAAEARAATLYDAIRQHLVVWNNITEANRDDNAVLVATETQAAMLNMLDSIEGDFSMVMIGDAFKVLGSVLAGDDSYYIKLYKEVIAERAKALQAENARCKTALKDILTAIREAKQQDLPSHEIISKVDNILYFLPVEYAPTPPATESARQPMWCPIEHPDHNDRWTVRILRGDEYQYDTRSYNNPYGFEEDAWNRADELNANES